MPRINISAAFSTGLSTDFAAVKSIDVAEQPLGAGGFGVVYHCLQINEKTVANRQVIKLFQDNGKGSAQKGYNTIQKLQQKLKAKHLETQQTHRQELTEMYPALKGVPQFSFMGTMKGKPVLGYSANDLLALGFIEFKDILEDRQINRDYQSRSLNNRMLLSYHLVSAFNVLKQLLYIHADFKAEALFVNMKTLECAIIDYDSGAVIVDRNDKPSTWGTQQDWLAPEIMKQLAQFSNNQGSVHVDLWSDAWAVIIGVHYLLFACHPLFYLSEISERSIAAYFKAYQWPEVDLHFPFFSQGRETAYQQYKTFVTKQLTKGIRAKLANSINQGYFQPSARTSYGALEMVLKITQAPPNVLMFQLSKRYFAGRDPVKITWEVDGASTVSLNGQVVQSSGTDLVTPIVDTVYQLVARNKVGKVAKQLKLFVREQPLRILQFYANKTTLEHPGPVVLSWQVSNATKVWIDQGVGEVTQQSQTSVYPRKDTNYTLTVVNFFGKQ
ncbi:MAG: serine/threonine-protein kinase, partial [Bacteroidota bacterium]